MAWKIYASTGEEKKALADIDPASFSTPVPIANGGTSKTTIQDAIDYLSQLTTKGDLLVHNGTHAVRMGVGSDNQQIFADSSAAAGFTYRGITMPDIFIFGDGSDGDVTINGTTTLTRDMYYHNLTMGSGGRLITNGWRVYVSGILDLTSTPTTSHIQNLGGDSAGGTAFGTGAPANSVGGGSDGVVGAAITSVSGGVSAATDAGGKGGLSGTSFTVATSATRNAQTGIRAKRLQASLVKEPGFGVITGGAGGSGGNSANGAGGGGGGGGGVVFISARTINRSSSTSCVIYVNGGTPGDGSAGGVSGGGGGGGGGGGYIYLVYRYLTGSQQTNLLQASGFQGGTGGTGSTHGGNGGGGGDGGEINIIDVANGTFTRSTGSAGSAGAAAVGTAGGTPGAGGTNLVSL